MNSQGVVLATAMAAVSGTVVLLALRLQKSFPVSQFPITSAPPPTPRPCLCSDGKRREKKKKKRVHFAEDVVDPIGNSEDFRRQHSVASRYCGNCATTTTTQKQSKKEMPGNRVALYNGILRDRLVHHRSAYAYC